MAEVDGDRLWRHVEAFSRWTKHAGTPGELASLRYVERELAAAGFAVELLHHDAYVSLPGPARIEALDTTLACITHSFSRASAADGLEAEVVDLRADGGRERARGAIALIDGIASPSSTVLARELGCVGQIHVSPHEHVHEMCISPVWGSPSDADLDRLPSTVVVTVALDDGERLHAACAAGPVRARLFADVDTGWRPTPILVGELGSPGGGADEPLILFTGHHDTWHFGVMDNGGANATMLEVARVCALERERWRRALRVIFWSGHSQGRYSSSAWYADHHWEELEARAAVHVNVDSTGGLGNTVVADTTAAAELQALAREALAAEAGQEFSGRRMSRAGDQSFWGIGVPAIFGNMSEQPARPGEANASAAVFGGGERKGAGTGWWWHTPADTLDKLDRDILVRDTRIYRHVVERLLTAPVVPLDLAAAAEELAITLEGHARTAGDRLDLRSCVDRARELQERAAALQAQAATATEGEAAGYDERLRRIARALVPLAYTGGDRFGQDPALSVPCLPELADAARIPQLAGDELRFVLVRLRRAANRTAFALRQALQEAA
jgi:hypothetical protein